jgi:hypothetical protein
MELILMALMVAFVLYGLNRKPGPFE